VLRLPTRCSKNENDESTFEYFIPDFIHIYSDKSNLNWEILKNYFESTINEIAEVDLRDRFLSLIDEKDRDSVSKKLVETKVFDISDPKKLYDPFPVEIEHEKERISDPHKKVAGMLYDGFRLQRLFRELLEKTESSFKHLHIIFTNRSIATWDSGDGRYHARTSVYGFPSIISIPGIVEAPAKPREFYIQRKALVASGMAREVVEEELKEKFRDRFIDYEDPRMTEILKGYVIQAFFYHIMFEPFCKDKNCRLFNAHWQEDMMHAQLEESEFCERHEGILERMRSNKF
jgi:hypothetical protein